MKQKKIIAFVMLVAITLSIIPSDTNIVKAAQTVNQYTDENASFKDKVFTLAVENDVNFTKNNGRAYAEFVAKQTGRYKFEINSNIGDKGTVRVYDDVEDKYVKFNFTLQSEFFYVDLTAGRKYTVEVEKSYPSSYAKNVSVKIMPTTYSFKLAESSGVLTQIGDTIKIDEQVEPSCIKECGLITYKSSDTNVATVDANGIVTAVKAGSASITVSTYDGYEQLFDVTVVNTDSVLSEKELTEGNKATADIKSGGAQAYFAFIPKDTGRYDFLMETQKDIMGAVYIYEGEKVLNQDDYLVCNRGISKADADYELTAGKTYTVRVCFEDAYSTGLINVLVRAETKSLEITGTDDSMIVGIEKTIQLNAKVTTASGENNDVIWKSDDENIVTVDQTGLVTSVNMGTTNITATTWDGITEKYEVVVQEPQISLNHAFYKMKVNDKFTLTPVLTYDNGSDYTGYNWDEVLFTARDESVVQLSKSEKDKCIVKAVGRGTTVVDVTMKIGTRSYELSCEVTVKSPYLNHTSCYLYIGNTQKLKVNDKKGTPKWSSSDKKVVSVSKGGIITAKKRGKAIVYCKIDSIRLVCKVTVDTPYIIGMDGNVTAGISCKMRIIGSNSEKKEKWSSSNKKIFTVKNGKLTAKKPGTATLRCRVNGITLKKKVKVYKNEYIHPAAKIKDLSLDRIYYQVVKMYFSGNNLKVKIKMYNTYTDRELKVIKSLDLKIYVKGECLHQRIVNKKVNMKAYSSKSVTVTVSKNSKMKHVIDLRNKAFTPVIDLQTAYYSYKYA